MARFDNMRIGSYIIDSFINEGSEGMVFSATDSKSQSQVAIKRVQLDLASLEKVINEYTFLQSVNSTYLAELIELLRSEYNFYIVYKKYRTDLNRVRRLGYDIRESLLAKWATEIAKGISDLHFFGILHRDLKPSNILLDENNKAVIADFGLATRVSSDQFVGTLKHMAPEIFDGEEYSVKSDVFGFGMILYEFMTDREVNREDVDRQNFFFRTDISEEARFLVKYCLKKDPTQRPNIEQVKESSFIQNYINRLMNRRVNLVDIDIVQSIMTDPDPDEIQISIIVDHLTS